MNKFNIFSSLKISFVPTTISVFVKQLHWPDRSLSHSGGDARSLGGKKQDSIALEHDLVAGSLSGIYGRNRKTTCLLSKQQRN